MKTIVISALIASMLTFGLGWVYMERAGADPGTCTFQCTPPAPLDCIVTPARCDLPPAQATTWQDLLLPPPNGD